MQRNIAWFDAHLPVSPNASVGRVMYAPEERPVPVYSLQGVLAGRSSTVADAVRTLEKGIYIVGGRKMAVR